MASAQYFNFIAPSTDGLPAADKQRFAELWQGYEQIFASVYQYYVEADLNIAIQDVVIFSTERWLPYTFDSTNTVLKAAQVTGNQDLSQGVNLSVRYLLNFSVNGGAPIEVDLRGANPASTTINEIKSRINVAAGFVFATGILQNAVLQLTSNTQGPSSSIVFLETSVPARNCIEFVLGLLEADLPLSFPQFKYNYTLPYTLVNDVPELRDKIRDESVTVTLESGTDYAVNVDGTISFKVPPPASMWAKRTLINNENPWNTFGFLMDIYGPNSPGYLAILQGLWFAFWTGPKPDNVKRSLYLLFGLPTAQEDATVISVTPTTITTRSVDNVERTFPIPTNLVAIVSPGDSVVKFQPLVSGIDVFDKINKPGFIADEIGRAGIQRFLTEEASRGPGDTDETKALRMLEEHAFLPQISVDAFISPNISLGNVKTFLNAIKPLHKAFLFQVIVGTFLDPLEIGESLGIGISMNVTPNLDSNQTTFDQQTDLDNYEMTDDSSLDLDTDVVNFEESVGVEVRSFGTLIDSFQA
jgi:hypothetical protein